MKETGIIMSGNNPKLILDLKKSMTRRVIKPQPRFIGAFIENGIFTYNSQGENAEPSSFITCPYGQVGDRLWVRETWCAGSPATESGIGIIPEVGNLYQDEHYKIVYKATSNYGLDPPPWRPSIFMPRWASRITLEITEVRVERVQEVTRNDAISEGVLAMGGLMDSEPWCASVNDQEPMKYPQAAFGRLWDSLNAKRGYGWGNNPFVWVISFERI